jgi:ACT domain-containing protein
MKAVITVTGQDTLGIIADVSALCSKYGANIVDISQSVMREYFAMIMLVDITSLKMPFTDFVDQMSAHGKEKGLVIQTMHEDIFNSMHRI